MSAVSFSVGFILTRNSLCNDVCVSVCVSGCRLIDLILSYLKITFVQLLSFTFRQCGSDVAVIEPKSLHSRSPMSARLHNSSLGGCLYNQGYYRSFPSFQNRTQVLGYVFLHSSTGCSPRTNLQIGYLRLTIATYRKGRDALNIDEQMYIHS